VWRIRSVIQLLAISLFFACALFPLVETVAVRTRMRRAVIILGVYMILALLVGLIGYVVVPSFVREVHTLSHDAPHYTAQLRGNTTFRNYDDRYHITAKLLRDTHRLPEILAKAAGPLKDVTVGAASLITQLITVLAVTFLLVLHGREYTELGLSLTGKRQQRYRQVVIDIKNAVAGDTLGNIVISVLATAATSIVLSILGVPYGLALGLWWASSTSSRSSARLSARSSWRWPQSGELPDRHERVDRVHRRLAADRRLCGATARLRPIGARESARDDRQLADRSPAAGESSASCWRSPARRRSRSSCATGGRQRASKRRSSMLTKGRRADERAGPRDQLWGAARPDMIIDRLTIRPIAPTTIRITPTVARLMPATWAVTANFNIAPTAIANKLSPMDIWVLLRT
jgi:hypothetical protein